jgi:hypothetical protein
MLDGDFVVAAARRSLVRARLSTARGTHWRRAVCNPRPGSAPARCSGNDRLVAARDRGRCLDRIALERVDTYRELRPSLRPVAVSHAPHVQLTAPAIALLTID